MILLPRAWTTSYTIPWAEGAEPYEYICQENNKDLPQIAEPRTQADAAHNRADRAMGNAKNPGRSAKHAEARNGRGSIADAAAP